jgi:hypothetical protein
VSETLEESVLREQLAQACEPGGALHRHGVVPEDAVIGRGRAMRTRRRVGLAGAALSVTAVAAVALTSALSTSVTRPHESSAAPVDQRVTVEQLDPNGHESTFDGDPSWLAGTGTVDGAKWQLLLRSASVDGPAGTGAPVNGLCDQLIVGSTAEDIECGEVFAADNLLGPQTPVALTGENQGGGVPYFQLGSLRADVAEVQVDLADGESLSLHPVTVEGKRYVAFAAPDGLDVSLVVAYAANGTEIAQQAPIATVNGLPDFVGTTWSTPTRTTGP